MSILTVENLTYAYDPDRPVLTNVSYSFELGRIYAILGPSGCGKTTLLSLLGGLDVPTEGTIRFNGQPITAIGYEKHRRKNVSFVFQNYNLIDYMTADENVRLVHEIDSSEILNRVGLTADEQKRSVLKLSGGQQQRVAIARALVSFAPVILADEPTGNLDEDTSDEVMRLLIEQVTVSGKCLILVTHSQQIADMADQILQINYGELSEQKKDV